MGPLKQNYIMNYELNQLKSGSGSGVSVIFSKYN